MEVNALATGALWPLLSAALAAAVLRVTWHRRLRWPADQGWPVAVGAGFAVGYLALEGLPQPPTVASDWLLTVLLPAALIAEMIWRRPHLREAARFAISVVTPALLLHYLRHEWSVAQTTAIWSGLAALLMTGWALLDHRGAWRLGVVHGLGWTGTATASGLTILFSGSVSLGQIGLALGAAIAGASAAWLGMVSRRHCVGIPWVLLMGVILCGHFYADLSEVHAGLLLMSPLLGAVAWRLTPAQFLVRHPRTTRITWLLLTVTPAAIAAVLAAGQFLRDTADAPPYLY